MIRHNLTSKRSNYQGLYRSNVPSANSDPVKVTTADRVYYRGSNKSNLVQRKILPIPGNNNKLASPKAIKFEDANFYKDEDYEMHKNVSKK